MQKRSLSSVTFIFISRAQLNGRTDFLRTEIIFDQKLHHNGQIFVDELNALLLKRRQNWTDIIESIFDLENAEKK